MTIIPIAVEIKNAGKRRHERVADREQRERIQRVERREPVVSDADDDAAGEVERDDDQGRDGVAFDELAGAVHRTVKVGLTLHGLALAPCPLGIECARVHVRVDGHLLSRHRVEREASRDFGDALRSAGDDDELNRHEDRKDDKADDQIAVNDEGAERRNDRAHRPRRRTRRQDQPGRRDVEREPEERGDEQRGSERGKLERVVDGDREQQDERRPEDVDTEEHVEQPRRQRHDQDTDHGEQQRREGVHRPFLRGHPAISFTRSSDATTSATAT